MNLTDLEEYYGGLAIVPTRQGLKEQYDKYLWNFRRYVISDFNESDNISIQTGTEILPREFLVVIDIDIDVDKYPLILDTVEDLFSDTVIVKSGGQHNGLHIHYLTSPPMQSKTFFMKIGNVEVKGIGEDGSPDIIMLPPSKVLKQYKVVHPELADFVDFTKVNSVTKEQFSLKINSIINILNK